MTKPEFKECCEAVVARVQSACGSLPMTGFSIKEWNDIRLTVVIKSLIEDIGYQEWCCWLDSDGEPHYAKLMPARFQ